MQQAVFHLESPKQLDLDQAEKLYREATDQRADKQRSILVLLAKSLKLGHAESGWTLINFIRTKKLDTMSHQDKELYFCYLVATAILNHTEASEQLFELIPTLKSSDNKRLRHLLNHYRLMGYDTKKFDDSFNTLDSGLMPTNSACEHRDDGGHSTAI